MVNLKNPLESYELTKMVEELNDAWNEYIDANHLFNKTRPEDQNYKEITIKRNISTIKVNTLRMKIKDRTNELCTLAINAIRKEQNAYESMIDANFEV